jgi:hypothetical protein
MHFQGSDAALVDDVQAVLDKHQIRETIVRSARAADREDHDLMRSAFHPDGRFRRGREARDHLVRDLSLFRECKSSNHTISNVLIELQGDVAFSETYLVTYIRVDRDGRDFDIVSGSRYLDRHERREGIWRITFREVVQDWSRIDPVVETWATTLSYEPGLRSRDDLSYHIAARAEIIRPTGNEG